MDEEFKEVDPQREDAVHLIKTFIILYDNWEERPPDKRIPLERLLKTFRQTCDNYGF